MKTKTAAAAVGIGKFVWPDIGHIDSVELLRVDKILPKPQIKDGQDFVNLSERKKLKYKVQSNYIIHEMASEYGGIVLCELTN